MARRTTKRCEESEGSVKEVVKEVFRKSAQNRIVQVISLFLLLFHPLHPHAHMRAYARGLEGS